jgi:hypothetical protein
MRRFTTPLVTAATLAAGVIAADCAAGNPSLGLRAAAAPVPVAVTISDTMIKASPRLVPAAVIAFRVVNRGRHPHAFRIDGKTTSVLAAGGSAVLRVDFARPGTYTYSASGVTPPVGLGDALIVSRIATPQPPSVSQPTPQGPGATTTTAANVQSCANPVTTTVTVTMSDNLGGSAYTFSPASIPCGTVTFQLENAGQSEHGLAIASPTGAQLSSTPAPLEGSQTAVITVALSVTGTYKWWDSAGEGVETTYGTLIVH